MTTKITLKTKDENGSVTNEQVDIESLNLLQYEQMMKVVNEILKEMKEDNSLIGFVSELFSDEQASDQDAEKLVVDMDLAFILKAVNSFETLMIKMPNKAFQLISVLSGIELDVLMKQKVLDVFDIYEAIIEENDVERLIKRIKKSLALTKVKMGFLNLARKATQE